ncbi:hypothetical protein APU01nite_18920 [Alkalibacterium putridalgicola]|uniref:Uncharacterized protein n=1 Tax=Alkalibacterium putridalgicola TaxID=426703 RepID=A0ABQ0V0J7_9LACT|nr:hypothetical protein APU01nite_18920 [Alkalibacterium putridalgicola]
MSFPILREEVNTNNFLLTDVSPTIDRREIPLLERCLKMNKETATTIPASARNLRKSWALSGKKGVIKTTVMTLSTKAKAE